MVDSNRAISIITLNISGLNTISETKKTCHSGLKNKTKLNWASLVAQWLRIHLPMQGTWVRALVQGDPMCHEAAKPVCHNY